MAWVLPVSSCTPCEENILPAYVDLTKHHINWQVDFARPHCSEFLTGHFREIAEEALERCALGIGGLRMHREGLRGNA